MTIFLSVVCIILWTIICVGVGYAGGVVAGKEEKDD